MFQQSAWYTYQLPPVDWFDRLQTVDDYVAELDEASDAWRRGESGHCPEAAHVLALCESAQHHLREGNYWDGDFAAGPYVLVLPVAGYSDVPVVGFMWKQGNNGTTFVASFVPLPHLDE